MGWLSKAGAGEGPWTGRCLLDLGCSLACPGCSHSGPTDLPLSHSLPVGPSSCSQKGNTDPHRHPASSPSLAPHHSQDDGPARTAAPTYVGSSPGPPSQRVPAPLVCWSRCKGTVLFWLPGLHVLVLFPLPGALFPTCSLNTYPPLTSLCWGGTLSQKLLQSPQTGIGVSAVIARTLLLDSIYPAAPSLIMGPPPYLGSNQTHRISGCAVGGGGLCQPELACGNWEGRPLACKDPLGGSEHGRGVGRSRSSERTPCEHCSGVFRGPLESDELCGTGLRGSVSVPEGRPTPVTVAHRSQGHSPGTWWQSLDSSPLSPSHLSA